MIDNLRTIAGNAASILTSDVVNRGGTFLLYALIARYLDTRAFGQIALALTLFYTFRVLAVAGLKTLITREVAADKSLTGRYLINGGLVALTASLITTALVPVFLRVMGYHPDTTAVILLISLGLLPHALSAVCEGVFQAWEKMHLIAWSNVPASLAKVGLAFLLLSRGASVRHVVLLIVVILILTLVVQWRLIGRLIGRPRLRIEPDFALALARSTAPFLGIDFTIAIWSSLQVLLLSGYASETEVGLYSAATQLMVPIALVFQSVARTVFPIMCRLFELGLQQLRQVSENAIGILMAVALPTSVGLYFLADPLLLVLYGNESFLRAGQVVRIVAWGGALKVLTQVLGQSLLAGRKERLTLQIVLINTLIGLGLGLPLIAHFGIEGAAAASLLTHLADAVQHYVPASRILRGLSLFRPVWKPAAACVCAAAWLAVSAGQSTALAAGGAGAIYTAVLLGLITWSAGGPGPLRAQLRRLWAYGGAGENRALVK